MKQPPISDHFPSIIATVAAFLLVGAGFQLSTPIALAAGDADSTVAEKKVADPAADAAWAGLQRAFARPEPPAAWKEKEPTPAEVEAFKSQYLEQLLAGVAKARGFYGNYPKDERASEARKMEFGGLEMAARLGSTEAADRLKTLEDQRLTDPTTNQADLFKIKRVRLMRGLQPLMGDSEKLAEAFERGLRELHAEFPEEDEIYAGLVEVAQMKDDPGEKKALLKEVLAGAKQHRIKSMALGQLNKLELAGKPLDLKFTAVDGREVDVQSMKGKVVLIDFWATWCGPCVEEIPNVKATYDELHPKGFEIVGLSFDQDKAALEKFVEEKGMAWAQYFDGKGWDNAFGRKFGITSIPAMWLVDKKGVLVEMNARRDLKAKVEKLLAAE